MKPAVAAAPDHRRRIEISNIPPEVTNQDLNVTLSFLRAQKLFGSIGTLNECRLKIDRLGRPLGAATVLYEKAAAAEAAIKEYNGRWDFSNSARG